MRYTTTDGPDEPLNAIQEGSLGDKMGIAEFDSGWPIFLSPKEKSGISRCLSRKGLEKGCFLGRSYSSGLPMRLLDRLLVFANLPAAC